MKWRACEEDQRFIWLYRGGEPWKRVYKLLFLRHLRILGRASEGEVLSLFNEIEQKVAKEQAFRFLAKKGCLSSELHKKLLERGLSEGAVKTAIEECQRLGYLDDLEVLKAKARREQRKGYGPHVIAMKLKQHKEAAQESFEDLYADQKQVLEKLLKKKFCKVEWGDFKARQKAILQLRRRGFDHENIREAIDSMFGNNSPSAL